MINSQFLALAQKYGLSQVPKDGQELMAALQGILDPAQMELLQYLFQPPEVFQQNPINKVMAPLPQTGAEKPASMQADVAANTPEDVAPGKDKAGSMVTQPSAPDAPPPAAGGGAAGGAAGGGANYAARTTPETALEREYGNRQAKAQTAAEFAANKAWYDQQLALGGTSTKPPAAATTPPVASNPLAAPTTPVRPWVPPVIPPTTPATVAGANRAGEAGYWDPGDATHPPHFVKSA